MLRYRSAVVSLFVFASASFAAVEPAAEIGVGLGLEHLRSRGAELGFAAEDLDTLKVTDAYVSSHNGVAHVYFRQTWDGLDVMGTDGAAHVLPNGTVFVLHHRDLLRGLDAAAANARVAPSLSAVDAVRAAAAAVDIDHVDDVLVVQPGFGQEASTILTSSISDSEIPARLVWTVGSKGRLELAWDVSIDDVRSPDWWSIRVNAATGRVIDIGNWTNDLGGDGSSYKVYEVPVESPNHSTPANPLDGRTTASEPSNSTASPFGWHDTNGVAGAEFTTTQGNNAHAYTDVDANNSPDAGSSPDGGAGLDFDFAMDLAVQAPSQYRPAAVTNLFYWNNVIHDVTYLYGFNEAAGNFQVNNYGNGGAGNDDVRAEAQDGSGTNNANFSTPADGSRPRMQMYTWTAPNPDRDGDLDAGIVAHEYYHGVSNRLTGGPGNVGCLGNSEQMGEGWSDYGTLMFTTVIADGSVQHGVGTYALNQPVTGPGIRAFPYSTSLATDPRTYQDSRTAAVPHGVGSVWTAIIWEGYWAMVEEHGFNPDVYGDWESGGNNLFNQLVFDGMKLQPCSPGMVDGRDAILAADMALTGGANQCSLWRAFAKRGLGSDAIQGSSGSNSDNTNGFAIPASCEFFGTDAADGSLCAGSPLMLDFDAGEAWVGDVTLSAGATPTMTGASFSFATNPMTTTPAANSVTISNTGGVASGTYTVTVNGTDTDVPPHNVDLNFDVTVWATAPVGASTLSQPADGATSVSVRPQFQWSAVAGTAEYVIEVDEDASFTPPLLHSATVAGTTYDYPADLGALTTYYWRVRPVNPCGAGSDSAVFSFETLNLICTSPGAQIPDANPTGVTTSMVVAGLGDITDLDVKLTITHTYIGDLIFDLTSPAGTTVRIIDRPASCSRDNIPGAFADDEGSPSFETGCNPANPAYNPGQHYTPNNPLSGFDGQALNGTWSLTAIDAAGLDLGTVDQWCLAAQIDALTELFSDGFESGNMSAWSATVP